MKLPIFMYVALIITFTDKALLGLRSRIDAINLFLEMCVFRFLPSRQTSGPENHLLTILFLFFENEDDGIRKYIYFFSVFL